LEDGTDEDRRWLLSSAQASYLIIAGAEGLADQATARPERAIESYTPGEGIEVALQIEALASIDKEDARIPGLIDELMRSRRDRVWHSTLDTAYAVSALIAADVTGEVAQIEGTLDGKALDLTEGQAELEVTAGRHELVLRHEGGAKAYGGYRLRYRDPLAVEPQGSGIAVTSKLERYTGGEDDDFYDDDAWQTVPGGGTVAIGETLRLSVRAEPEDDEPCERVMIECPLPAGVETHNLNLLTWDDYDRLDREEPFLLENAEFQRLERRDDRVLAATEHLESELTLTFLVRPAREGLYHLRPARAFAMYEPTVSGTAAGFRFRVTPRVREEAPK
ncbi:MAG: alpha-2-macroglobulin family protein, partial [Planctomycetota bacterium]